MLIPKSVYYGMRGMAHLVSERHLCSIQEIARKERIPAFFLEKIFQQLKKAGLISSKKGKGGGFFLVIPPRKITLKKIVKVLTKERISIPCLIEYKKGYCSIIKTCNTRKGWQKFYRNFNSVLKNFTLVDFLK